MSFSFVHQNIWAVGLIKNCKLDHIRHVPRLKEEEEKGPGFRHLDMYLLSSKFKLANPLYKRHDDFI